MKEKVAIIANKRDYAEVLADMFGAYFGAFAEFKTYCTSDINKLEGHVEENLVIISAYFVAQSVKDKISSAQKTIIANLTLRKDTLYMLDDFPENTKAYLVNTTYHSCMETMTMLYNATSKNINLIPFYPGCGYDIDPEIDTAITVGEKDLVPGEIHNIIDLGQRLLARTSIDRCAELLGIENYQNGERVKKDIENQVEFSAKLNTLISEKNNLLVRLNTLLTLVRQGIIIVDSGGQILSVNKNAEKVLANQANAVVGFSIFELFPELQLTDVARSNQNLFETIVEINNRTVIVTVSGIEDAGKNVGYVIMLEYFNEAEARQHKFRRRISGSGHVAIHCFDDILGNSKAIIKAKKTARQMAKSDSNVCIYGESGTGKELFAQAIHNESKRKNFLFVALNCSAVPENLLESELFGYEGGAFSGAKNEGKIGLLELAHAHIDGLLNFPSNDVAIIHACQVPYEVVDAIKKKGYRIIEAPSLTEAKYGHATNFVAIEPGHVVSSNLAPRAVDALQKAGITVDVLDLSELNKGRGSVHCMTAFLKRDEQ